MKGNFLNLIKNINAKPTANIILDGKNQIMLLYVQEQIRAFVPTTSIQYCTGGPT